MLQLYLASTRLVSDDMNEFLNIYLYHLRLLLYLATAAKAALLLRKESKTEVQKIWRDRSSLGGAKAAEQQRQCSQWFGTRYWLYFGIY